MTTGDREKLPPDFSGPPGNTGNVNDQLRHYAERNRRKADRAAERAREKATERQRQRRAKNQLEFAERIREAARRLQDALASDAKGRSVVQLRGRARRGEPVVMRLVIGLAVYVRHQRGGRAAPTLESMAQAFNRASRGRVPEINKDGARKLVTTMRSLSAPGECWDGIGI